MFLGTETKNTNVFGDRDKNTKKIKNLEID